MSKKLTEVGLEKRRERERLRSRTPERQRWRINRDLVLRYGITIEDYEKISESQGHVCAICGNSHTPSKVAPRLVVDHCHQSGKVRGLLCSNCNLMLGHSKDNIEVLERAIEYLVPQFNQ